MLDRAGVEQTVLVGHSLGALVAAPSPRNIRSGCFIWCWPTSRRATARRSRTAGKSLAGRQQQMALGGEAMAQGERQNCCALAREADVATVAAGMRRLRRDGYLAAAWMLAHDDIHRWLADYRGRFRVVRRAGCHHPTGAGAGVALRYGILTSPSRRLGTPAISIMKPFLINSFYA
jgi:hypothetical protein